ncbi:hypothetical protein B0H17DRAFT_1142880 [Mycena rosella]|uniref:Uncharacterized protein n=1 Tax=Mycena rosella TaxID=1033263 RepID=A0AAD7CWS3_MYCRO|nr:hypothetical protein B0H17DRAFT_1142880 [Mycena rosella]
MVQLNWLWFKIKGEAQESKRIGSIVVVRVSVEKAVAKRKTSVAQTSRELRKDGIGRACPPQDIGIPRWPTTRVWLVALAVYRLGSALRMNTLVQLQSESDVNQISRIGAVGTAFRFSRTTGVAGTKGTWGVTGGDGGWDEEDWIDDDDGPAELISTSTYVAPALVERAKLGSTDWTAEAQYLRGQPSDWLFRAELI